MKTKEEIENICSNIVDSESINDQHKQIVYEGCVLGYTQCQEDKINEFLSLIEEYKEKELPHRNEPYHYEAEIAAGLKYFEIFIKEKLSK